MSRLTLVTNYLKSLLNSKTWVVLVIAVVTLILGLITLHQFGYNGDDVAEQTLLQAIKERGLRDSWLPPDPWLFKYPLYIVMSLIFQTNNLEQILLSSILLNITLVVCVFLTACYFFQNTLHSTTGLLKRWLPFVWVFSLMPGFVGFIRMPNARNMELGLMLISIVIGCWFYFRPLPKPSTAKQLIYAFVALTLFSSISFYSDPYVLVFTLSFFTVFFMFERLHKQLRQRKFAVISTVIVSGFFMAIVLELILDYYGFHVWGVPTRFISLTNLLPKINQLWHSLLYIFSYQLPIASPNWVSTIVNLLNQGFGLGLLMGSLLLLAKWKKQATLISALAVQPLVIMLVFIVINFSPSLETARYLLLIPLYLVVTTPLLIASWHKGRQLFVGVLSLLVFCNIVGLSLGAVRVVVGQNPFVDNQRQIYFDNQFYEHSTRGYYLPDQARNAREYKIISELSNRGLTKGYGHYWDMLIINYLSDYRLKTGQVLCGRQLTPYYWVLQDRIFIPTAGKTFFVVNQRKFDFKRCNLEIYGPYVENIQIDNYTNILVYDYDIAIKFPKKKL